MASIISTIDRDLASAAVLRLQDSNIIFQFPPKVTNDSRRGNWSEENIMGDEPYALYMGSDSRNITMEWTYIVGMNRWTSDMVHTQLKRLRGYFSRMQQNGFKSLVAHLRLWDIGGDQLMTARILDVSISHGKSLIGRPDVAFPLRTDVKIDVKLWTRGGVAQASGSLAQAQQQQQQNEIKVFERDLRIPAIPPEWQ